MVTFSPEIFFTQKYGGISKYFVKLFEEFNRLEVDFTVHAQDYCNEFLNELAENDEIFADKMVRSKFHSAGVAGHFQRLKNDLKFRSDINKSTADIIHYTMYPYAIFSKNAINVITIHDMTTEVAAVNINDRVRSWIKKAAVMQADHIIAVSDSTKRDLINIWGIDEKKITMIYHGVEDLQPNTKRLIERPYLLFVGQRSRYKNFTDTFLAYAHSHADDNVDFLCFGGGNFTEAEKKLFAKTGLTERVHQISGSDLDLCSAYTNAEGLLYTSRYEGFGFPIVEAMKLNCPVLTSNISSMPEIGGAAAMYCDPDDKDSIILGINDLLNNAEKRATINLEGIKQAAKFSWEKSAAHHLKLYESLMN